MTTRSSEISKFPSFVDVGAKGAPVEYDSLVSDLFTKVYWYDYNFVTISWPLSPL